MTTMTSLSLFVIAWLLGMFCWHCHTLRRVHRETWVERMPSCVLSFDAAHCVDGQIVNLVPVRRKLWRDALRVRVPLMLGETVLVAWNVALVLR
jgi:hypothetical protein